MLPDETMNLVIMLLRKEAVLDVPLLWKPTLALKFSTLGGS